MQHQGVQPLGGSQANHTLPQHTREVGNVVSARQGSGGHAGGGGGSEKPDLISPTRFRLMVSAARAALAASPSAAESGEFKDEMAKGSKCVLV